MNTDTMFYLIKYVSMHTHSEPLLNLVKLVKPLTVHQCTSVNQFKVAL